MSMIRIGLGVTSLVLITACGRIPFWSRDDAKPATDDTQIPPHVRVEFQDVRYDGWGLSGRILVSPEDKSLRLHKRFSLYVQDVEDCARRPLVRIIFDYIGFRLRPEDLLILEPGYWYGHEVSVTLFDEYFTGIGPECVDVQFLIYSFDGKPIANVPIRALRPPMPETDGGVPEGLRHLINDPLYWDLKPPLQVDLSEVPQEDGGVAPPPP